MTTAELTPAIRRYGLPVRESTIVVAEYLEGTAILFSFAGNALIAARRQDHGTTRRHDANLMGIYAGIELVCLSDFASYRAIRIDSMNGNAAGIVESGKQKRATRVDRDVDWPVTQPYGVANRDEPSGCIDSKGIQIMIAWVFGCVSITARNIEISAPLARFLNLLGYDHGVANLG